jgi:phage replication O-like protein O
LANPQTENGYTPIANEVVEAFSKTSLGFGEWRVLWVVLRRTYGWRKKKDKISISQIQEMTGLSRRMVVYCLQNLEAKKMITIIRKRGRGNKNEINEISFQKNYDLWVVQEKSQQYNKALKQRKKYYEKSKEGVVQEIRGSARNSKKVVQEIAKGSAIILHPQKQIQKQIQKKEYKKKYRENVSLTEKEYHKLTEKYGKELTEKFLNKLDNYKGAHGRKYKSDYKAILNWVVDEVISKQPPNPWTEVKEEDYK